jgi:hypothetical protein
MSKCLLERWSGVFPLPIPGPMNGLNLGSSHIICLLIHAEHWEQAVAQNPSWGGATETSSSSCADKTDATNATKSWGIDEVNSRPLKSEFEVFQNFQYLTITWWRTLAVFQFWLREFLCLFCMGSQIWTKAFSHSVFVYLSEKASKLVQFSSLLTLF